MEIKVFIVGFGLLLGFFLGTIAYVLCTKKLRDCWLAISLSVIFSGTMAFGGYQMLQDLWTLSN